MIRMLPRLASCLKPLQKNVSYLLIRQKPHSTLSPRSFTQISFFTFSTYPKHQVLTMPALSPTMTQGKVLQWTKKVGDKLEPGDIICQIQTDKATVGFEVQDKGYLARVNDTSQPVAVGTPVVVIVKKADAVKQFQSYSFSEGSQPAKSQQPKQQTQKPKPAQQAPSKAYPKHNELKMPALSPTMTEGKIEVWNIKEGQEFSEGDALCDIETDKATVPFQASQKGVLAKIIAGKGQKLSVGQVLAVSVKKKDDVGKFADFSPQSASSQTEKQPVSKTTTESKPVSSQPSSSTGGRILASPVARSHAKFKGISLQQIGQGSGPKGVILKQDVQNFQPSAVKKEVVQEVVAEKSQATTPPASKKSDFPENPCEEIPLNNMRKTIAARLTESKTTIPHYYINSSIAMDNVMQFRTQLNKNEAENGTKISINDIIVKAMALALRDYPVVNSQWHGNVVKRFKHSDVSVAVATEGGLITPIVFRAETLGLIDIAKRTKDIAKRAREGKLDPRQYIGGTSTVSNLGMFGINTVTSVINPPQSTILGVGKTEKKIIFDENAADPEKPYKVQNIMQVIVSADHRVVDGAVAAQWLTRIKKYLENPIHMIL